MSSEDLPFHFVVEDPVKEGSGEKYRRKRSLAFGNDTSTKKRPRTIPQEGMSVWKFSEALESRLSALEFQTPKTSLQLVLNNIAVRISKLEAQVSKTCEPYEFDSEADNHQPHLDSEQYLAELAVRISRVERLKRVTYDYDVQVEKSDGKYMCPDKQCQELYSGQSDLNKHCQRKHGPAGLIVSQKTCYPCAAPFKSTRDLILHEKSDHGEEYQSRIEKFLPYFKQSCVKAAFMELLSYTNQPEASLNKKTASPDQFQPTTDSNTVLIHCASTTSTAAGELQLYEANTALDVFEYLSSFATSDDDQTFSDHHRNQQVTS